MPANHETYTTVLPAAPPKRGGDSSIAPDGPGLSIRSNFAWALSGNLSYAACQWGIIVALAKLTSSFMVGQFALGLAIVTPVLMFTNLQLRSVQATDAQRRYSFGEYLGVRSVTILVALGVLALIALEGEYIHATALVILAVAASKAVEALSDVFYGLFQFRDRLDFTGRSMMLRGVLSLAVFSGCLYMTRDVLWGVAGLVASFLTVLIFFDLRKGLWLLSGVAPPNRRVRPASQWALARPRYCFRKQARLVWLSLPLGVVMTLLSLNLNMPRYFIHAAFGEHQLGIFSAMAYMMVAVTTVGDAMGQSAVPRMSRLYAAGRLAELRALLLKLVICALLIGLSGIAVAKVGGRFLLEMFYSPEYAGYGSVFVLLMASAAVSVVASVLTVGITSSRHFRIQVLMFAVTVIANATACFLLVPKFGLTGAAISMVIAALVHVGVAGAVMVRLLFPAPARGATEKIREPLCGNWEASS